MKALVLKGFGGVDQLVVEEINNLKPDKGEAVVQIYSASLNRRDVWIRLNKYPNIQLPAILGSDGSGKVISVGSDDNKNLIGKDVVIYPGFNWGESTEYQKKDMMILGMPKPGTCAEEVLVPITNLFDKPKNLTFNETATLPIAGLTAFRAITNKARPKTDETVLITGIGGGVAMFALQFALMFTKNVFVTSSSEQKISKAISLGAIGGIVYSTEKNIKEQILNITKGKGIDVVIDGTTGDNLTQLIDVVNSGARIVIYGSTSLTPLTIPARHLFWKQIKILGTTFGTMEEFKKMLSFIEEHNIHPIIDSVFSFNDFKEAYKKLEKGNQCGKIVIEIKK
ncbi:MAG: zinc-binding dehydrogenase [Bacteroidetes bacterium]|nr:zinc-binding dehydrogenase [Bacteroidota bacterium]